MTSITCGNCQQTHDSIDAVKACYAGKAQSPTTSPQPLPASLLATEKQIAFIKSLASERELTPLQEGQSKVIATLSKSAATNLIGQLLQQPKRAREGAGNMPAGDSTANQPSTRPAHAGYARKQPELLEGIYRHDGVIYKVQRALASGSGHMYAKVLKQGSFRFAPGAMKVLKSEERLTLEQAKEYGALYGTCCVCGRTLTDERSIADGIGPVCGKKSWWADAYDNTMEQYAQEALHETHDGYGDGS